MIKKHVNMIFANFTGVEKTSKNHTPSFKKHGATKSGFTMVELGLAMAFISVLLITIAIITTNIVTIYQKGLTLKAVNSVGRGLVDELTAGINTAPSVDTTSLCTSLVSVINGDTSAQKRCEQEHAFDFIFHAQYSDADENGKRYQYNGIFCTGYYSYIWNTYYGVENGRTVGFKYLDDVTGEEEIKTDMRLMRIEDKTYRLCSAVMNSDYTSNYGNFVGDQNIIDITTLAHSTEDHPLYNYIKAPHDGMLDEFDLDLMLYEFFIFPISQDSVTLRTYMSGSFILGTLRGNLDISRSGDYCQPDRILDQLSGELIEGDTSSNFNLGSEVNYCAINKFNFAARTAGSGV